MPRKNKTQEPVTPQELSKLNDKTTQDPTIRKYHVNTDAKNITGLKKRRKILRIVLGATLAVLLLSLRHWSGFSSEVVRRTSLPFT